jgi:hypothetical protein
MTQQRITVVPCTNEAAKSYVDSFHRHHGSSVQARFCLAALDEERKVRGVVMVGRPVARLLDNGWTLEVNRLASDGCENACSALYGASRRVAKEMGYRKLITYIREDEPGTSLRAAGWQFEEVIRSWNMPGRMRTDKTEIVRRGRWSVQLNQGDFEIEWPALSAAPKPARAGGKQVPRRQRRGREALLADPARSARPACGEFGPFDFDPCPFPLPEGFDGLTCEWGQRNYVNPPFGSIVHQGKQERPYGVGQEGAGGARKGKLVVLVYPIDKWILMLLKALMGDQAKVRNLGDVRWLATEDRTAGKGTGRHIAAFILEPQ